MGYRAYPADVKDGTQDLKIDQRVACRRQKKYENPKITPVPAAYLQAAGPSPTEKCATRAEARLIKKPA